MPKKKIIYKSKIKIDDHSITRVLRKPSVPKKKVSGLKKKRQNLYTKKSYWHKKWIDAPNKKEGNAAQKQLQSIQHQLNDLNEKLGVSYDLPDIPQKIRIEKGKRSETLNIWQGVDKIKSIIKNKFYKTFIIDGKKYSPKPSSKIIDAYDRLETLAMRVPRGTPFVEFIYEPSKKIVNITIF